MDDWTAGYVADIDYTYGYYSELNPLRTRLALLNSGLTYPEIETACELGFGQGLSTNLHAAASSVEWYGTDFNPAQADFARELANAAGSNTKLYDDSFAEFAARPDLPEFDFIGLHGIWSWISDENRTVLVEFIRRKLKFGGVLYISYNTMPGWAAFAPMRDLMTQHAEVIGADGRGIVSRIDGALDFSQKLLETNPLFFRANPTIKDRLEQMLGQNRHYLAHEYFNKDWHPMLFYNMHKWLEPAKLDFAASAHYLEHIDSANLTAEQLEFINNIPDMVLKQSVRDFMLNQTFRRDYWVKGARHLSTLARFEKVKQQGVILSTDPDKISLDLKTSQGEAKLSEKVYKPIIEELSDFKVHTIEELIARLGAKEVSVSQLMQALFVLGGRGQVSSVQDEQDIEQALETSNSLNSAILDKARTGGEISHLASPVTGGGEQVSRIQQLFLLALRNGKSEPSEWADFAWQVLSQQGHKILKDNKALESAEDNQTELANMASEFSSKKLQYLRALKVA